MDIHLPKIPQQPSLTINKADLLNLRINQQLNVKVVSTKAELQSLLLEISHSSKTIQLQTDLPANIKPGQTLRLIVTNLTPAAEFKLITIAGEKNTEQNHQKADIKPENIILKQIPVKTAIPLNNVQVKDLSSIETRLSVSLSRPFITAKIISITNSEVLIKLNNSSSIESSSVAYTKKITPDFLQQQNPIIKLTLAQLESAHIQPIQINAKAQTTISDGKLVTVAIKTPFLSQQTIEKILPPTVPIQTNTLAIQIKSAQPSVVIQNYKPGQSIQFEINKTNNNVELKILEKLPLNLIQGQIISAKVVAIKGEQIKLALQLPVIQPTDSTSKSTSGQQLPPAISKTAETQTQLITLSTKQLNYSTGKQAPAIPFKVDQQFSLQVTKTGENPEFKQLENNAAKLNTGQVLMAKVIEIKNNTIQLQLTLPVDNKKNAATQNKQNIEHSTITLNKNQLITAPNTKHYQTSTIDLIAIKPGQLIKLEVTKTGAQTEFNLLAKKPTENLDLKILQTLKEVLPIQAPPSEAIKQIIQNIPILKKNEKIPDALKRIAKEIMASIPAAKDLQNPKRLKQSIKQSGLFLEAKLANDNTKIENSFQSDFKGQLLKMQHSLKQEVSLKTEQNNQSNELSLLKEMQQKTDSSLARIVLNQLTSLPKDEGQRQMWIIDLPFLHKENAESVKIEINREQASDDQQREENWSVDITITPPELATIHCKVSCFDKTISTRFWSKDQQLVNNISQNLDYLKTQFEKSGITPGQLSVHIGMATKESHQQLTDENLFNLKV